MQTFVKIERCKVDFFYEELKTYPMGCSWAELKNYSSLFLGPSPTRGPCPPQWPHFSAVHLGVRSLSCGNLRDHRRRRPKTGAQAFVGPFRVHRRRRATPGMRTLPLPFLLRQTGHPNPNLSYWSWPKKLLVVNVNFLIGPNAVAFRPNIDRREARHSKHGVRPTPRTPSGA